MRRCVCVYINVHVHINILYILYVLNTMCVNFHYRDEGLGLRLGI
jgi:hypothetical protein